MFDKILIANRGEIAVRIIRACHEMGIKTVAIYSTADKESLHVKMADESVCVGPASSRESYLNIKNILSATVLTGAQAIHPGFGFLSENSKFAQMCRECNICFIGPDPEVIHRMGNKLNARDMMIEAGIPVVPGSRKLASDEKQILSIAQKIGYPVMIKASAGGGGKGIRVVQKEEDLLRFLNDAKCEAKNYFGDDTIYIEKYIENPKHVEIQILADQYGNIVHLGERDCSIQRRNQKILEEAPCAILTDELRRKIGEAAIKAAKHVGYKNAGTVEFLLDSDNNFYFIEMNTRIQVEHPVTEYITDIDLIKEQIKVAAGKELNFSQNDIKIKGHSIECRINAEDPSQNFMPSAGKIEELFIPSGPGVRVDSALYQGCTVTPFYDSMIAKLIVYACDRKEAISRMIRALNEFRIKGVKTNKDYHLNILNNKKFITGHYDTNFISKDFDWQIRR